MDNMIMWEFVFVDNPVDWAPDKSQQFTDFKKSL